MSLFFIFYCVLLHQTKSKRQPLEVLHKNEIFKKFTKCAQRNPCVRVFINKVIDWRPSTLIKRNYNTDVFLRILKNFKNTFLTEYHRVTSSETHQQNSAWRNSVRSNTKPLIAIALTYSELCQTSKTEFCENS